jgi:hypothetical protein
MSEVTNGDTFGQTPPNGAKAAISVVSKKGRLF